MMKKILAVLMMITLFGACACAEGAGQMHSLTTGAAVDWQTTPMVVLLDNDVSARPISGIKQADVVYEMPISPAGHTAYVAVFNDTVPEIVESVGTAYQASAELFLEWGGGFVYCGAEQADGVDVAAYLDAAGVIARYDALNESSFFFRDTLRKPPYNVVCQLRDLALYASVSNTGKSPLTFSAESPTVKGQAINVFRVAYNVAEGYYPSYEYIPAEDLYYRFYCRSEDYDADGMQLTYSNVVVMHMEYQWTGEDEKYPLMTATGSGKCEYFIGGKHFVGTWQRDEVAASTVFLDDTGAVVNFKPGKTFIQIASNGAKVELVR